jgi:hypothetical protein
MAPHKFNEWLVGLKFYQSAKASAARCHVVNPRGLSGDGVRSMVKGMRESVVHS